MLKERDLSTFHSSKTERKCKKKKKKQIHIFTKPVSVNEMFRKFHSNLYTVPKTSLGTTHRMDHF